MLILELHKKFEKLELKFEQTIQLVIDKCEQVIERVDGILDIDKHEELMNKKRAQLIEQVDKNECEAIKKLARRDEWIYLFQKYQKASMYELVKIYISDIAQLSFKNDFEMYRKFRYYHLLDFVQNIRLNEEFERLQNFYRLTGNKFLAQDEHRNELVILDRKLNRLKTLRVRRKYFCCQLWKIGSRILLNLVKYKPLRTFIYIFDFDLSLVASHMFPHQYIFIKPNQDMFFCENYAFNFLFNLDFELVDQFRRNHAINGYLNNVLEDRLVFNCSSTGEIQILMKDSYDLVNSIVTRGFYRIRVNVDEKSRIYVTMYSEEDRQYQLRCFDCNGKFLFKQNPIFPEFNDFFVNDQNYYLFDYNITVKSFF
jgi:hypothetical protein